MQHLDALASIAEPDVVEADVALDPRELLGSGSVDDLWLLVEHVGDLVEGGYGRKERVVELGELLDRVEEVGEVTDEGEQRADGHRAAEDEVTAVAQHDRGRNGREQVDVREIEAVQDDGPMVRGPVMRVHLLEMTPVGLLARERLDDAHAGDVLGERRCDESEPLAHLAVRA